MAAAFEACDQLPQKQDPEAKNSEDFNYSRRAQWLRAAVLGGNDGLVSVASLMMGIGAIKTDMKSMILAGFAGLVAGASSMAIGEFISVYTQLDIQVVLAQRKINSSEIKVVKQQLPNPMLAAVASALAFSVGAMVPILAAAFVRGGQYYKLRVGVVVGVVSLALVVFGGIGAVLGKTSVGRSCARVLLGGWIAMAITFGMTKLVAYTGLQI